MEKKTIGIGCGIGCLGVLALLSCGGIGAKLWWDNNAARILEQGLAEMNAKSDAGKAFAATNDAEACVGCRRLPLPAQPLEARLAGEPDQAAVAATLDATGGTVSFTVSLDTDVPGKGAVIVKLVPTGSGTAPVSVTIPVIGHH